MNKDSKYFFSYLGIVIGVSWAILISWVTFASVLNPILGPITLTHPLIIFILYLPSIAGLMISYISCGYEGLKNQVLKIIPRKEDLFWFPVIFGIFVVFELVLHYGCLIFGIPLPEITMTVPQIILKSLWNFIEEAGLIGGVFGWIGFVLPYLQGKLKSNIYGALLTGFLFGLWVLPGYGVSSVQSLISYVLYVMQLMSFLVFISYIFNATKGNLSVYLFAFWLAATGSHVQLYNFNIPVQLIEITFFCSIGTLMYFVFKSLKGKYPLAVFPDYILEDRKNIKIEICDDKSMSSSRFSAQ